MYQSAIFSNYNTWMGYHGSFFILCFFFFFWFAHFSLFKCFLLSSFFSALFRISHCHFNFFSLVYISPIIYLTIVAVVFFENGGDSSQVGRLRDWSRAERGVDYFCDEWGDGWKTVLDQVGWDGVKGPGEAFHFCHDGRQVPWRHIGELRQGLRGNEGRGWWSSGGGRGRRGLANDSETSEHYLCQPLC